MTLNAFIFDLDGTLVDTERLWVDAMCAHLADRGVRCPKAEMTEIVYGRSWTDIYRTVTGRFPVLAGTPSRVMALELHDYYVRLRAQVGDIVIPSSAALLKRLAADYPVIIVSGSPHADVEDAVRLLGAESHVRFVLGAEDYPAGKPSPSGFLAGAERLGVPPETCLVFEDSWAGVTAAKAAGMWCVALDRSGAHQQNLAAADWVLADLAEFSAEAFTRRAAP
ncbi:MAG: HAD family phosphatase [Verrucomicrobiota bacterium]|jgi:HAD superfamily hydrolase (TIGR01509 family)|nr:HAD family phosphatase [Verrucomicrobiota bacterium]